MSNSSFRSPPSKLTFRDLNSWSHELYCAGHLLEAALAHYMYTGSYRLLGPLMKYVKYIDSVFGLEEGKKKG